MKNIYSISRIFVLAATSTLALLAWSSQSFAWGGWGGWGGWNNRDLRDQINLNLCVDFEVTSIDADVLLERGEFINARNIEVTIENNGTYSYWEDRNRWPKTVSLIFMDGRGRGPADGMPYLKKVRTIRAGRAAVYSIPDHFIGPPYIESRFPDGEVTLYAEVDVGDIISECDEDNNYLEEAFEID